RRPELIRLSHLKMGKKYQEKALKSTLYPQLYASAAQYFVYPSGSFFKEEWMDFYVLGVNLKWEFWNWGRDLKKARQSRYEYERIDLQQMDLIKRIRQQVEETYLSLNNIRERILMQKKLLFQEQKRFQITENKYSEGQATALDVSDAENRLTEAELTLDNYYTEWNRTMLRMEFFTGTIGNKNFEVTQ
ncbi:MAG: TolC family protein, partial [Calditrichia bacterium]